MILLPWLQLFVWERCCDPRATSDIVPDIHTLYNMVLKVLEPFQVQREDKKDKIKYCTQLRDFQSFSQSLTGMWGGGETLERRKQAERFVETKDEINSILEPLTMSHTGKTLNKEKQKKPKKSIWRTEKGAKVPKRKMTEKKDEKGLVKKIKRRRRVILCKLIIFSKLTCQHLCQLSPVKTTGCKYIIAGWFFWPTRGGPAFSRP